MSSMERTTRMGGHRRQTRRSVGTTVAALGLTAAAAACGTGAGTPAPPAKTLDTSQKDGMTGLVWSSDGAGRKDAYDAMVARFNQQFPNVTVNRIAGGSNTFPQLITMLAGDQRVDIVGTRPDWLPAYEYDSGPKPLQNLRTYMKTDSSVVKESDHVPGIVDAHSWQGTLYALPVGVYTNNTVLNLDLLQQKGIAPPPANWTADQMVEIARKTTDRKATEEDSIWGFDHWWQGITTFAYVWIRGNGGEPLTPNDSPTASKWSTDQVTLDTIQWLVDLSQKQQVMPVAPLGGAFGPFTTGKGVIQMLETNNLYQITTAQATGTTQFKWDVAPGPMLKKGRYQYIGAFSYGLSRNTKNPDVAWELLKNIVGPAGQTNWYQGAKFAPSITSLLNGAYLQDKDPPASKKAIVDAITAAKPMPKSPRYQDIDAIVAQVLTTVRAGTVAVRAGLTDIDQRVSALLK
jgi:multiple sugar transport system substrate-binding protein